MNKNDPTGKQHYDVTKTSSQKSAKGTLKHEMSEDMPSGDFSPKTPSGMLSGLRGVLADRASNMSNEKSVGSGSGPVKAKSQNAGMGGGAPRWSNDSCNTNFGG